MVLVLGDVFFPPGAQKSTKKGLCKLLTPKAGQDEVGFRSPRPIITANQVTTNPEPGLASLPRPTETGGSGEPRGALRGMRCAWHVGEGRRGPVQEPSSPRRERLLQRSPEKRCFKQFQRDPPRGSGQRHDHPLFCPPSQRLPPRGSSQDHGEDRPAPLRCSGESLAAPWERGVVRQPS